MTLPNLFLMGAPKCGSTALYTYLGSHPQVFFPADKEPHYFAEDFPSHRTCTTFREYEQLYKNVKPSHTIIGDASVLMLYSRTATKSILDASPNAKFVIALRNPAELVVSLHRQFLLSGREVDLSFSVAWERETNSQQENGLLHYPRYGRLSESIHQVLKKVSINKLYFVFLEDISESPRDAYLELLKFLELQDDGRVDFPKVNEGRENRWPFASHLVLRNSSLKQFIKTIGLARFLRKFGTRPANRDPISPQLHQKLREYYRTDIEELSQLTNRDLSHWLVEDATD